MKTPQTCKLCGLTIKTHQKPSTHKIKDFFCCSGCRMVYTMLMEADPGRNPESFKETDIYRRCQAAGVIPGPEVAEHAPPSDTSKKESEELPWEGDRRTLLFHFTIRNMWCPACAWIVEEALLKRPGIRKAACNFSSDRGRVLYDPVTTSPNQIIQYVNQLGYQAASPKTGANRKENRNEFVRLAVSAFLTMNVMMLSWALYSGFFTHLPQSAIHRIAWPVFAMASVVFFYGGLPIHKRARIGVKTGTPGMEALITAGASCAYVYSIINMLRGSIHLYFDTASMLIVLVLTGKMLERTAKERITKDLDDFFTLVPEKVRICTINEPEGRYVSIRQLGRYDLFRVDAGEIIPADGAVERGTATLDESSLTGEPRPVNTGPGEHVKSGARLMEGSLFIRATKTGEASTLGQMIALIEKSLASRSPAAEKYEKPLKLFVPAIIGIALLTGYASRLLGLSLEESLTRAVTVMVISCPCALGLAVPLALVAGVSAALKKGILVRDYSAFERTGGITSIVFDKTGTITTGTWQLLHVTCHNTITEQEALALTCGMEKHSDHYVARTLKTHALANGISHVPVDACETHPNGLTGSYLGKKIILGSREFVEKECKKEFPPSLLPEKEDASVVSRVYLSVDNEPAATFTFGDTIRSETEQLISHLKSMNVSLHMLSGDADATTTHVASKIGISNTRGKLLPHEKAAFIEKLQAKGHTVAMVGDGINDAPAMASADVAVALHSGFDPGREVASVSLMRKDPLQLLDLLSLSRKINRKVTQNLLFALIYNLISIPVAMTGLLNPLVAATAMLLSSLSVTGNTLLLIRNTR